MSGLFDVIIACSWPASAYKDDVWWPASSHTNDVFCQRRGNCSHGFFKVVVVVQELRSQVITLK